MDAKQKRVLQSLRRVHEFLGQHPLGEPPVSYATQLAVLRDALAPLDGPAVTQELRTARQDWTVSRSPTLAFVHDFRRPIPAIRTRFDPTSPQIAPERRPACATSPDACGPTRCSSVRQVST